MKMDNIDDLILEFGFVIEAARESKMKLNYKDIEDAFFIALEEVEDVEQDQELYR